MSAPSTTSIEVLGGLDGDAMRSLLGTRRLRTWPSHDVEDAMQEAVLRALDSGVDFADVEHGRNWLTLTAQRILIDRYRSPESRRCVAADTTSYETFAASSTDRPEAVVEQRQKAEEVRSALSALTASHQTLLWLRDGHGMSVSEAATRAGVATDSAHVLLSRARKRFKARWRGALGIVLPPFRVGRRHRGSSNVAGADHAVQASVRLVGVALMPLAVTGLVTGLTAIEPTTMTGANQPTETWQARASTRVGQGSAGAATPSAPSPGLNEKGQRSTGASIIALSSPAGRVGTGIEERGTEVPDAGVRATVDAFGIRQHTGVTMYEAPKGTPGSCLHLRVDEEGAALTDCDESSL